MLHSEAESIQPRSKPGESTDAKAETPAPSSSLSAMRPAQIIVIAILCALLAPILFGLGMWLQYEYVSKPRLLKEAGKIDLGDMDTSVPPETILPAAKGDQ